MQNTLGRGGTGGLDKEGLDPLADPLPQASDSEAFEELWQADPEAALAQLAEEAALGGRMDIVMFLVEKLGGAQALIERCPALLQALAELGDEAAIAALMGMAPFAWARRKREKEKMPRWEVDLVAAAVSVNAMAALDDAIAQGALSQQFFMNAQLSHARTLMFEARHGEMVDFLAAQGVDARARDLSGASALAAALARASAASEDAPETQTALSLARLGDFDDPLSADLLAGSLGHPSILKAGLEAGARHDAFLPGHKGALRAAVEGGHEEAAMLLAAAGADPYAADRDGLSAYDMAMRVGAQRLATIITEPKAAADALAADAAQRRRARELALGLH